MKLRLVSRSWVSRQLVTVLAGIGLVVIGARTTRAQIDSSSHECAGSRQDPRDRLGTQALSRGYKISITRDTSDVEEACIATLRDRAGTIVRRDAGYGARVSTATGLDVDGDGHPDLVLEIDTGGGNHCCWGFVVLSLTPRVHLLFDFTWSGAAEFKRDPDGRVSLWSWEGGLEGIDRSMAGRIAARRVYRYRGGKLVDITPQRCREIFADTVFGPPRVSADTIKTFTAAAHVEDTDTEIASAVEQIMLQYVFCRDAKGFERTAALWPAGDRARFVADFKRQVVLKYKEYKNLLVDR